SQYLSACAVQATDFIIQGVVSFSSPEINIPLHLTTEFVRSSIPIGRHSRLASSMIERPRIQAASPHMRIRCACFDKRASHPYLRKLRGQIYVLRVASSKVAATPSSGRREWRAGEHFAPRRNRRLSPFARPPGSHRRDDGASRQSSRTEGDRRSS